MVDKSSLYSIDLFHWKTLNHSHVYKIYYEEGKRVLLDFKTTSLHLFNLLNIVGGEDFKSETCILESQLTD